MNENPSILVVDDTPANLLLITYILKKHPYTLLSASNGRDALDVLAKNKVDLVLLDIMMPVMNGYEVLSTMRNTQETKEIPVVMVSALCEKEDIEKAYRLGANDYIDKPVFTGRLVDTVRKFV